MAGPQDREADVEGGKSDDTSFVDGPDQGYASFLRNSKAERKLLKDRLAEADKGVFVSAEAMHRWIESWGREDELSPPEPDVFLKPHRS